MHPTLDLLIERFRAAQDLAIDTLTGDLQLPLPTTARDWWSYCGENGLYNIREIRGIGFFAHGFGVALQIGSLSIDFDFGRNGEIDGFDSWRLYLHAKDNLPHLSCDHLEVNRWLQESLVAGELVQIDALCFDPKRRAKPHTDQPP